MSEASSDNDRYRARDIQYVLDSLYPSPVPVPLNSKDNFTFLCGKHFFSSMLVVVNSSSPCYLTC
jgi:hypothetical protein